MTYFNTNSLINYCHHMYRANINFLKERFQGVPAGNMARVYHSKRGRSGKQRIRILKKQYISSRACGIDRKIIFLLWIPKYRRVRASTSVLNSLQKARKKEVTTVQYYMYSKSGYSVCPACGYAMEREYQNYCEVCGQHLAWNQFRRNNVTIQRYVEKQE